MTQPSDGGFQQAAGDLQDIRHGNDQIQQGIANGKLRMKPDVAEKAAQAYEHAARRSEQLIMRAVHLQQLQGLGEYPSGKQLTEKFKNKAGNGSTGAADLLRQFSDELQRKADLFRKAGQSYREQEARISEDLKKGIQ
jgi:hypothetical protein